MVVLQEDMNFASVAAAGVVPQERPGSGAPAGLPPQQDLHTSPDPNLIAKAPGYKPPGQRTASPQVDVRSLSLKTSPSIAPLR